MTFNEKVDAFMVEKNFNNLKQLALASEIPYTTLKDFYDKKSADNSRLATIRKLAKYMGCSMDYLAYDEITDFNYKKNLTTHVKWFNNKDEMIDSLKEDFQKDLLDQYNALFDKDDRLTEEQKKFFMDFLTEKHKKIDENIN